MRIAFDAKRAFLNQSGLGNYSRTLLKNLCRYQSGHSLHLLTPEAKLNTNTDFLFHEPDIHIHSGISVINRLFPSPAFFNTHHIDIYHGLSNELPLNAAKLKVKKVVTIHDVIFLRYPQLYRPVDRAIYTWKTRKACEAADTVIAISHQTKNDLMEFLKVPEQKIKVVYQSCDELYTRTEAAPVTALNLPPQYLLYVGTIEPRKNLLSITKALKILKNKVTLPLVVIGKPTPYKKQVQQYLKNHGLEERVLFAENIPLEQMPAIYRGASLFIYPSTFEGFGIPIIEALYSKVPVITGTGSCFEEAGGKATSYINPELNFELAESIEQVLNSPKLSLQMVNEGYNYVQRFNARNTSQELMQVYTNG
ncbi:MAG: glycosyltransferase family 4 protein [Bacteroidia bacterium]|nr:glycosyltransferase family 4 protein [Bacteroidia bacterium]